MGLLHIDYVVIFFECNCPHIPLFPTTPFSVHHCRLLQFHQNNVPDFGCKLWRNTCLRYNCAKWHVQTEYEICFWIFRLPWLFVLMLGQIYVFCFIQPQSVVFILCRDVPWRVSAKLAHTAPPHNLIVTLSTKLYHPTAPLSIKLQMGNKNFQIVLDFILNIGYYYLCCKTKDKTERKYIWKSFQFSQKFSPRF